MSKLEMIKQLEYLIAFQTRCLNEGNWSDFDKVENEIKKLEEKILYFNERGKQNSSPDSRKSNSFLDNSSIKTSMP